MGGGKRQDQNRRFVQYINENSSHDEQDLILIGFLKHKKYRIN
jgi:hypothetical protein